jgi:hypothetical protein
MSGTIRSSDAVAAPSDGTLSISAALAKGGNKPYLTSLASHGYEMGVGSPGRYAAHAHRGFTDIAFAPGGLRVRGAAGWLTGSVHISCPGQWFGPLEFESGFWFLKFFESAGSVCSVPDKITDRAKVDREGCLVLRQFETQISLHLEGTDRILTIQCDSHTLRVGGLLPDRQVLLVSG